MSGWRDSPVPRILKVSSSLDMNLRPIVTVLAAGRGSRFAGSQHKLAQPFGESTVLGTVLGNALASGLPVVVVTTAALAAEATRHVLPRDVIVVRDEEAARGMGHSIAAGVSSRVDAPGWLLLPGDMPLVRPATMLAVAEAVAEYPVVYAQYHGRRGHPVGFAAELRSELVKLTGDEGARRLLARYPAYGAELDDPGVLVDVDTVADLAAARAQAQGQPEPSDAPATGAPPAAALSRAAYG
jgi:molybdenum cofactor cytidylyltransferase